MHAVLFFTGTLIQFWRVLPTLGNLLCAHLLKRFFLSTHLRTRPDSRNWLMTCLRVCISLPDNQFKQKQQVFGEINSSNILHCLHIFSFLTAKSCLNLIFTEKMFHTHTHTIPNVESAWICTCSAYALNSLHYQKCSYCDQLYCNCIAIGWSTANCDQTYI